MNEKVDFDVYADDYEDMLRKQLNFFSNDRGYFSSYKINILKKICEQHALPCQKILEFGCGIGLNLPWLQDEFKNSNIYASDISNKSLEHVNSKYKDIHCVEDKNLEQDKYDLIFVAGVFHHINPTERSQVTQRLLKLLNKKGSICIFEHNPYNPVTRHMVNTCPFDEDAVLLKQSEVKKYLIKIAGLNLIDNGYCLYFPEKLKSLTFLEPLLKFFPLGGQHYMCAQLK